MANTVATIAKAAGFKSAGELAALLNVDRRTLYRRYNERFDLFADDLERASRIKAKRAIERTGKARRFSLVIT